jgi:hypothetical protein
MTEPRGGLRNDAPGSLGIRDVALFLRMTPRARSRPVSHQCGGSRLSDGNN